MRRLLLSILLLGMSAFSAAGHGQAPQPIARVVAPVAAPASAPPTQPDKLARLKAADAEGWIDGYMPYALKRGGIPGAVVVIVKDGAIVFAKGYGVSDVETGAPVDPAKTLFRPGSISKLFTWTAVMQLVEQGKIDLDADVNSYLDFKIPPYNGKPVTMRQILTHSAGFEEVNKNVIVLKPGSYLPFEKVLKLWVPARVVDPGKYPAYSNYAVALAGYVVQRVSGEPFDDYIANHILKPLGMVNSTFVQPLPKALAPQMSKGYFGPTIREHPFEMVSMGPAGALSATGEDMARFMIAHLNRGSYNGAQILKPETADLMHRTALQVTPPANGMALGFMVLDQDGNRAFGHGGDTEAFHSMMTLFPDSNVGIFVSLNGAGRDGAGAIRYELTDLLVDRYLPAPPPVVSTVDKKTAAEHAALLAGTNYVTSRTTSTNFLALGNLLGQVGIDVNPDGTISLGAIKELSGVPKRFREIAPYVWQEVGGSNRLVASVKDGKVAMWALEPFSPIMVFLPVEPAKSARILSPLGGVAVAVLLLSVLAWPVTALVRRSYGKTFPLTGARASGYRLSRGAALLALIGLGGIGYLFATMGNGLGGIEALAEQSGLIVGIQTILAVGLVGGLLASAYNLYAVFTKGSGWFWKLWSLLLLLAFAVLLYIAIAYRLVSFSTNF